MKIRCAPDAYQNFPLSQKAGACTVVSRRRMTPFYAPTAVIKNIHIFRGMHCGTIIRAQKR